MVSVCLPPKICDVTRTSGDLPLKLRSRALFSGHVSPDTVFSLLFHALDFGAKFYKTLVQTWLPQDVYFKTPSVL